MDIDNDPDPNPQPQSGKSGKPRNKIYEWGISIVCVGIIFFFGARVLGQSGVTPDEAVNWLWKYAHWITASLGAVFLINGISPSRKVSHILIGLVLVSVGAARYYVITHPIPGMAWQRGDTSMVWIPSGEIEFSNAIGKSVTVKVDHGFWIDKTEMSGGSGNYESRRNRYRRSEPARSVRTYVSWLDADFACEQATRQQQNAQKIPGKYIYRLPTTNEWTYASLYNRKKLIEKDERVGIVYQNHTMTSPISGDASSYRGKGLVNMEGNLWEWCQDQAEPPAYFIDSASSENPFKAAIGGGFNSPKNLCSPDSIISLHEQDRFKSVGFRMVLSKSSQ